MRHVTTQRFVKGRGRVFWNSKTQKTFMKPSTIARKHAERAEAARVRAARKK